MSMSGDNIKSSLIIVDMLLNDVSEFDMDMDNLTGSTMEADADKTNWNLEHDNHLKNVWELENNHSEFELFSDINDIMSSEDTTSRLYDNAESSSCSISGLSSVDIKPFIPPSEASKSDDAVIDMDFMNTLVEEEINEEEEKEEEEEEVNVDDYDENDNYNDDSNSMAMKPIFIQQPQILKTPARTGVITRKQAKEQISISKQLLKPDFITINLSNQKTIKAEKHNGKTINAKRLLSNNGKGIFEKNKKSNGVSKSMPILKRNKVVSDSSTSGVFYPRLYLTSEERKLAKKDGVKLPSHYPLTTDEEKDLKRIRRKIKNKIAAQNSRNQKKEYINSLEDRIELYNVENSQLMNNMSDLQTQNEHLNIALKQLQNATVPDDTRIRPSMCLLILMVSLALIIAPNLRPTITYEKDTKSIERRNSNTSFSGRWRSLLSYWSGSPQSTTNLKDRSNMVTNGLSADVKKDTIKAELGGLLKFNGLVRNKDNNYSTTQMEDYYEPEWDDDWTKAAKRSAPPERVDELIIPVMKRKRETKKY